MRTSLLISGGEIIDGVSARPIEGYSILVEGTRIKAIEKGGNLAVPAGIEEIDARGKYVIPGLMNANVHLLCDVRLENLARHLDQFENLILEAAQIALKNGLTTVFDTWGPRRYLMAVRDRIQAGNAMGSRIFCAGNIIGFDGPLSSDFFAKAAEVASAAMVRRINAIWTENVGRRLMWMSPQDVSREVRAYIGRGIDFVKYGSNEHFGASAGAFLAFSERVQAAVVEEAHGAGISVQAHSMSVEGLRIAVEAGCDIIQHANVTGPVPIPETTLELMCQRRTNAVVFPWTHKGREWLMENVSPASRTMWDASEVNARKLIASGVPILLGNDAAIYALEMKSDPQWSKSWIAAPEEASLGSLMTGHFTWLKAMEEKGYPPMEMLKAATRNIAEAYGKLSELGSIEVGKIADLIILDRNPLQSAENYRCISVIVKDGLVVDRDRLPTSPVLTRPLELIEEEQFYVPSLCSSDFPGIGCC